MVIENLNLAKPKLLFLKSFQEKGKLIIRLKLSVGPWKILNF